MTIAHSDEQQFRSQGGIRIFGHEWLLIGVVSTVWFILFLVALGITDIARYGDGLAEPKPMPDEGEEVSS